MIENYRIVSRIVYSRIVTAYILDRGNIQWFKFEIIFNGINLIATLFNDIHLIHCKVYGVHFVITAIWNFALIWKSLTSIQLDKHFDSIVLSYGHSVLFKLIILSQNFWYIFVKLADKWHEILYHCKSNISSYLFTLRNKIDLF